MHPRLIPLALLLALLAAACGTADRTAVEAPATASAAAADDPGDDAPAAVAGEVVVQAAASLTDAFDEVVAAFTEANPEAGVIVNYAGSQSLATQILEGAPADVFASANAAQMQVVADEGLLAGEPRVFATNALAIAVEAGNPFGITGLADLADPSLVLVLADPEVPAGDFAAQALEAAGVAVTPSSLEVDVRSVLSKVELGEADAGIVYTTDLVTAGDAVQGVAIPEEENVLASYPIAALADAPNPGGAAAFVDFVLSPAGQAILREHGFGSA